MAYSDASTGRLRGTAYTTSTTTTAMPTRPPSLQRHPHGMPTRLSLHDTNNNDNDVYAASQPTATPTQGAYAAQPTRHLQRRQRCLRGITAYSDIRTGYLRGSAYTTSTKGIRLRGITAYSDTRPGIYAAQPTRRTYIPNGVNIC